MYIELLTRKELKGARAELKYEYLSQCLVWFEEGVFRKDVIKIVNNCVSVDDRLFNIEETLSTPNTRGGLRDTLERLKLEGNNYVNSGFYGFRLKNDGDILKYGISIVLDDLF
jgi:hypothetical protein